MQLAKALLGVEGPVAPVAVVLGPRSAMAFPVDNNAILMRTQSSQIKSWRLPGRPISDSSSVLTALLAFAVVLPCVALLHVDVHYALALAVAGTSIWVLIGDYTQGFLLLLSSMILGYRTVHVTELLKIHPSQVLVALLLCSVLMSRPRIGAANRLWLPFWVWCFIPFWAWGWLAGSAAGYAWDLMLPYLMGFLLLIPLFIVARVVLQIPGQWQAVATAYYVTATSIATLGLFERFFPGAAGLMSGFFSNPAVTASQDGFGRARFSFWGHPDATFVCLLAIPFAVPLWSWKRTRLARTLILIAVGVQLGGAFIGGYRIVWLMLIAQLAAFLFFRRKYIVATLAATLVALSSTAMPASVQARIDSLMMLLAGTPTDTSGAKHLSRFWAAVELVKNHPEGLGWGASGWVHCDFLQVAADLGILAGLLFAGAYLRTLGLSVARSFNSRRHQADRALSLALLMSFGSAGALLSTQPILVLPQVALPVLLIWAFVEIDLRQQVMP